MELSMLLGVVAAAAIAEWITALVIVAFALAAEILEDLSLERGRDSLQALANFLPTHVTIKQDSGAIRVTIEKLQLGDVAIVKTGEHLAVDGVVAAGSAALDQSHLTGEPLPVDVTVGSTVFSESIVSDGGIEVRSTRLAEDSSYGRIIAAAIITYIATRDLESTISVILIAGARGVAAGTPLALIASIASAAHHGGFVKDAAHFESLAKAREVFWKSLLRLSPGMHQAQRMPSPNKPKLSRFTTRDRDSLKKNYI